ncbi:MAG TPA: YCF48-related protein [Flavobacteriales bacterium]|nr:T9SS type A sorting domain-containing protein [Flavobacteriales bacterium]HQV74272.1 YCF48-related protein [Flavobacteriales bacterium]HQW40174.1 YCF48-related protein [Flavobacteriales bacterium]
MRYFTLLFFIVAFVANAQWELVTPIKNTSEFKDLVMVNDLVGYATDWVNGAILSTADGGITWQRRQHLLQNTPLAIHMWDEERGVCVGNSGIVYRTTDGFRTATSSFNPTYGHLNCVFFLNDTLGWVGTQSGKIYRSTDAGVTWTLMQSNQPTSNYMTDIQFVDENIGYASCYAGEMLKSTDGGLTWQNVGPFDQLVLMRDLHFFTTQEGVAVGSAGEVIRTTDGGVTWDSIPSNTTYSMNAMAVQGDVIVACGWWGRTIRSTDRGLTWTELQVGSSEHQSVALTPSGHGMLGTNGRIQGTNNMGLSWAVLKEGTSSSAVNKMSFANNNIGVAGNGLRTTDGGRSWVTAPSGGLGVHLRSDGIGCRGGGSGSFGRTTDFFATGINGTGPNVAIRCTWSLNATTHIVGGGAVYGGIYRTTNNGSSWTHVLDVGNITISDLWFVDDLQGYAVGEYGDNYRTSDGGVTWQPLPPMGGSPTVFFNDALHGWTKYWRTTDGGDNWTQMFGTPQSGVSIFFTDNDTGYVVASTGQTEKSTDGGVTWANVLPQIFNAGISDAAYVDGYIVIGGAYGDIYRAQVGCSSVLQVPTVTIDGTTLCSLLDGAIQWYRNAEPVPDGTTQCIDATTGGSYAVVVVDGFGCTSAASEPVQVVITGVDELRKKVLTLSPNPANSIVQIERTDDLPATVFIIDAQGRSVIQQRIAGTRVSVDVSMLNAGAYMVRVVDNGGVSTTRMVKN